MDRKFCPAATTSLQLLVTESCCETGIKVVRRMGDWRWGERFGNDLEGNKKMVWKEVKGVRKGDQARDEIIKDVNGQISQDCVAVRRRCAEYFEQVPKCGRCQGSEY